MLDSRNPWICCVKSQSAKAFAPSRRCNFVVSLQSPRDLGGRSTPSWLSRVPFQAYQALLSDRRFERFA